MIYYLNDQLDDVFNEVARKVPNVVLCGNKNRAERWRRGISEETKADNYYASREGMRDLLKRHGYSIVREVREGDEIVVGRRN
jgi:tRNA G37 N-methylase TrmD